MTETQTRITAAPAALVYRLLSVLYDSVLVFGMVLLGSALVTLPIGLALPPERAAEIQQHWAFGWLMQLILFGVPVAFHCYFWARGGQTIGMRAWRLRVTDLDGGQVSLQQALIRYLSAWVSALVAGLGFVWSLFDPERMTWHDRWSATRLVREERR